MISLIGANAARPDATAPERERIPGGQFWQLLAGISVLGAGAAGLAAALVSLTAAAAGQW